MKDCGSKQIDEEFIVTLGDNAYELSQVKIWLHKFRNGDLFSHPVGAKRR
jgi:hypothetical protein